LIRTIEKYPSDREKNEEKSTLKGKNNEFSPFRVIDRKE